MSAIKKLNLILSAQEKTKIAMLFAFAFIVAIFELMTAGLIVGFANAITNMEKTRTFLSTYSFFGDFSDKDILLLFAVGLAAIFTLKSCLAAFEIFFQNYAVQKMAYKFKNKLLNSYAQSSYNDYLKQNSSFRYAVVSGDADIIFSQSTMSLVGTMSEAVIFAVLMTAVIIANPALAAVIFLFGAVFAVIIGKILLPRFYNWGKGMQEASMQSTQTLFQFFHAFKEIVLLQKKREFIDHFSEHSKKLSMIKAKKFTINSLPRLLFEVLFVLIFVIAIFVLSYQNQQPAEIVGLLSVYLYAGFRLMPGLNRIISHLNLFKSSIFSINRLSGEYLKNWEKEQYADIPEFTFNSHLTVSNVSFSYDKEKRSALENISFSINKGEYVGIVGETGSGKSTLMDLLLGLIEPDEGSILIDNQFPVKCAQWHQKIGYVPQTLYLLDNTIAANIAFGFKDDEIDLERVNEVVDAAQLRSFIAKNPDGLQTIVGEQGVRISGGERQRIAIARALYTDPEVLIFDEATSALDQDTEKRLMDTIYDLSKDRTVIMIAHRLSTLAKCDKIIALKDGKMDTETTPQELSKQARQ